METKKLPRLLTHVEWAELIEELRKSAGLTEEAVYSAISMSHNTYSKIKKNQCSM